MERSRNRRSGRDDVPVFKNRTEAGEVLARSLEAYAERGDTVVLGLPRGGVPVALEVAKALRAPLDVFIVRKLGVPGREELAMGAIASGGVRVVNADVVNGLGIDEVMLDVVARREERELERRERLYIGDRPPVRLEDKTAIVVDDGLATGASMRAAVHGVKEHAPASVMVAVPTAAPEACAAIARIVDDIVCLQTPEPFYGVGAWYEDFAQTTDEDVARLLDEAARLEGAA
ncbi:MAG: phosphoribosyltransferase family protein [Thermoleophilia bacterium]|jgi:putative phosphoribosyl transferase|nr:phosphoribosyltransferase family protein [Thermoleophilia bacterium]